MDDSLKQIKSQALDELTALQQAGDLSPEEKFNQCMDQYFETTDQKDLALAYEASQDIEEPQEKAKALSMILNEIDILEASSKPDPEPEQSSN
jgi:hypothetical protein